MPQIDQETSDVITDLEKELSLIDQAEKNKFLVSEKIINEVLSEKMPDIKITKISYSTDATRGRKISLTGVAPSREELLVFSQALQKNKAFLKVNLPISNFIKGSNIEFNLDLIPS